MFTSSDILKERYQLQQALGRTAAGRQTWLATDLHSNEKVVVKLLAFSPQMEWQELKLFEREAQVLQSLNHPRIPKYRDYFSIDREAGSGLPWFGLVQDYLRGLSLQNLLERGCHFSEEQVKYITIEILKILVYLHQLSPPVLHRDLKPSNLLLGEYKKIYLVDFGAVQAQSHLTGVTFTVVGTSGYAPLEQFWGRAVAASDLYALGATLIHLLTGTPPAELPQKNSRIQFSDRVSLDPNFVSWIEQMTEIILEKRFQTAQEALEALTSPKSRHSSDTNGSMWRQVVRPNHTRIQLQKTSENLQIQYSIEAQISWIKLGIILFNFCYLILVFILMFSPRLIGLGFIIVLCLLFLIPILNLDLLSYFNNLYIIPSQKFFLSLDPVRLIVTRKSFNNINEQEKIKTSEIQGVFIQQCSEQYQLIISCAHQMYTLDGDFKKEECIWLAQEIQNWLNSQ